MSGCRFSSHGSAKSSTAVEYAQRRMRALEGMHRGENAALEAMATAGGWKAESGDSGSEGEGSRGKTWLETEEEEVSEQCVLEVIVGSLWVYNTLEVFQKDRIVESMFPINGKGGVVLLWALNPLSFCVSDGW